MIFMLQILPCGCDNFKVFHLSCSNFLLHIAKNQFLDKFNNGGRLLSGVLLFIKQPSPRRAAYCIPHSLPPLFVFQNTY